MAQALGIPCYLDNASPQAWQLPENARYRERPYDYGKIWWSLRMAQLGYTALYLDNDVAVLKDPITPAYVGSPYDIQVSAGDVFATNPYLPPLVQHGLSIE